MPDTFDVETREGIRRIDSILMSSEGAMSRSCRMASDLGQWHFQPPNCLIKNWASCSGITD
jgi:hypothetical protein